MLLSAKNLVFALLTMVCTQSLAHGPPVQLPLYVLCIQTSNLEDNNRWIANHLFVFEEDLRSRHGYLLNGKYFRAEFHAGTPIFPEGVWHQATGSGIATLAESEDHRGGVFSINAVGYKTEEETQLPTFVLSANIDLNDHKGDIKDIVQFLNYWPRDYLANCRNLTKAQALTEMKLLTFDISDCASMLFRSQK